MCMLLPSGETRNYINIRKERSRLWDRSKESSLAHQLNTKTTIYINDNTVILQDLTYLGLCNKLFYTCNTQASIVSYLLHSDRT